MRSKQEATALEAELCAMGTRVLLLHSDLSDPTAVGNLIQSVEAEYGRIDALINCVGAYHRIPLMEESIEGWHVMFDRNLHPVFYLSRAAAPGMIERKWGRIVNFSIVNADQHIGQPYITGHYIAKVGVLVLTRSLAKALAPHGITVNAISPGFISTNAEHCQDVSKMTQSIPAGYIGSPNDAAAAVCYLLSEEARYVNGTNIHLSGAWGI